MRLPQLRLAPLLGLGKDGSGHIAHVRSDLRLPNPTLVLSVISTLIAALRISGWDVQLRTSTQHGTVHSWVCE